MNKIKIIECPRDAIQSIGTFIPTKEKIDYINQLLHCGFDTIDFGSFVSPKVIPQMMDTADVVSGLDLSNTDTKLLAIVPNTRGGEIAAKYDKITYLGFPFSISNEFLYRNTNTTMLKAILTISKLLDICENSNKELVVYVSMAFGNPYDELWSIGLLYDWVNFLVKMGVKIIALSDTVGVGNPSDVKSIYSYLIPKYPSVEFGLHAHTTDETWSDIVDAAYTGGCRRFDSVIGGVGGCPLSGYELLGNLKTEDLLNYATHQIHGITKLNKIY